MSCIYQFKVVLRGISPMIWRRLLLRSDHSIADLHYTIQIAMGWSDTHLHRQAGEFFFWGGALLHRLRSKRLIREPYEGYTVARSA
jgi:hypothetical protein